MRRLCAWTLTASLIGCAGQSGLLPGEEYYYEMQARTSPALTQPIAVGQSESVTVTEQRCIGSGAQGNSPPPNAGCGASYAPATVNLQVSPDEPCPVTVTSAHAGKFVATRTAPGDANISYLGVSGWCQIMITDPKTGGYTSIFV